MTGEKGSWEPTTRTQELSKFLYRAPDPAIVMVLILPVSLIFGLLIQMGAVGLTYGLMLIALPAYLSAWASTHLVEWFGGKFYFRRSILTSFVGVFILGFMLIFGEIIRPFIVVDWRFLLIYGYSIVFSMRYLVIRTTCLNYHRFSFIVSSAQTFFALIFHWALSLNDFGYLEMNNFLSLKESSFGILSSFVLFISSLLFFEIVNAPLKTDVGLSGTDLMGYFLSYMTEGTKEIERLFLPLQEKFDIPFSVLAVKKKDSDTESEKPFHALVISPSVHPGPVGEIGGGNLPSKLAAPLSDLADHILVPHGASTNDTNPSTSEECKKVVKAVREIVLKFSEGDFSEKVQISTRTGTLTTVHLFRFGKQGVVVCEPWPTPFDDMSMEMFREFQWSAMHQGFEDIMVIDGHNHSNRDAAAVHLGDRFSVEMGSLLSTLAQKRGEQAGFRIGFGAAPPESSINSLGPKGVEAVVIEAAGKKTAFILLDGNNMLPEMTERLRAEAKKLVDLAIVTTADNHVVNATLGGYNPIGLRCSFEELSPLLNYAIHSALKDLGGGRVAVKTGVIRGINIFGFGNTNRLVATINSTVAVIRRAAIACIILAITASALVYYVV